jgi:hypothetical protein
LNLDQIRAEQRHLADLLAAGTEDERGVLQGIADWIMEETLLLNQRECATLKP